ncbi:MAG: TPM domain-containing protein [Deltaproteobacteria bacterium]|nr:TPM domain-containing protein [Deltaproteobacteria bacterium]
MKLIYMPRYILLIAAIALTAAFPASRPGQRIYDLAGLLKSESVSELEKIVAEVERQTTAEVAVVTVVSLDSMTVDEYANQLFNRWGIGKADVNNGVLFLIAPNERRARIEVGYGLEPLIDDGLAGEILDSAVIPEFKKGNYSTGVMQGTRQIARILLDHPEAARGVPGSAPSYVLTPLRTTKATLIAATGAAALFLFIGFFVKRREHYSTTFFIVGNILVVAITAIAAYKYFSISSIQQPTGFLAGNLGSGFLALLYNWRAYFRFGPHNCSKCGTKLVLMNEKQDDAKLTEVQRLEEQLGAVDYDVWFCPSCLSTDTERYVSWFSGFNDCPKCAHRTYKEERRTITSATRHSTGLARVTGNCASCKHSSVRNVVIPRVTSSSSSGGSGGGGSFGGGSSGGGGASRGW